MNFVENKKSEAPELLPYPSTPHPNSSALDITKICIYKDIDFARHCSGRWGGGGAGERDRERERAVSGDGCVLCRALAQCGLVIIFWINENTPGQSVTEFFIFHYWPRRKNKINLFSRTPAPRPAREIYEYQTQLDSRKENYNKLQCCCAKYEKLYSPVLHVSDLEFASF